jgi:hypothetical protein
MFASVMGESRKRELKIRLIKVELKIRLIKVRDKNKTKISFTNIINFFEKKTRRCLIVLVFICSRIKKGEDQRGKKNVTLKL